MREVFINDWNKSSKQRLCNTFRNTAEQTKVYGWWISKLKLQPKNSTGGSFSVMKHSTEYSFYIEGKVQ